MLVIKAGGEKEEFSEKKLRRSIQRAGVPDNLQNQVVAHIVSKLYDNIKTSEIYDHIIEFLDKSPHPYVKTKLNLKQAIMALGPSGYPFEDFASEILKAHGYKTSVRNVLQGACVRHEVDIVAEKDGKMYMIETKFHNTQGIKTNVHVALYVKARFDDVRQKNNLDQAWVITNTKPTLDAITYAKCNNMRITGWSYPENESFADLIEQVGFIPITAISSLSDTQKQELLSQHIVLCRDICQSPLALETLHLSSEQKQAVLAEAQYACNISLHS